MVGVQNEINRKKWIRKTLMEISPGKRILDAGAGELANKKFCAHLKYVSQDFCQYDGSGDKKGLQMGAWDTKQIDIVGDITNIPENDESFDVILCSEVLEHLPDPIAALAEFKRLLKIEGILILTAPFCSLTHFAPYHYCSGFNRYFYEHHLKKLGFKIVEIGNNGNFFEYIGQEVHRIPAIANQYTTKKISILDRLGIKLMLKILEKFSKNDIGSDELLCFGYHVKAIKQQ